jgi:hypothetical protein
VQAIDCVLDIAGYRTAQQAPLQLGQDESFARGYVLGCYSHPKAVVEMMVTLAISWSSLCTSIAPISPLVLGVG